MSRNSRRSSPSLGLWKDRILKSLSVAGTTFSFYDLAEALGTITRLRVFRNGFFDLVEDKHIEKVEFPIFRLTETGMELSRLAAGGALVDGLKVKMLICMPINMQMVPTVAVVGACGFMSSSNKAVVQALKDLKFLGKINEGVWPECSEVLHLTENGVQSLKNYFSCWTKQQTFIRSADAGATTEDLVTALCSLVDAHESWQVVARFELLRQVPALVVAAAISNDSTTKGGQPGSVEAPAIRPKNKRKRG